MIAKKFLSRALATSLVGAGALGVGLAVAAPATAAPTCSATYVCLFNETDGSDNVRSAFKDPLSNYAGSTYFSHPSIGLDNSVEAVHYNWGTSSIRFWTQGGYGGTVITSYAPGQQGFRNWTAANSNIASAHQAF